MPSRVNARLNTDRVIDEAMRMADEEGLDGVTIRRLAARLAVTPMALYHYVRNKDQLLDLMADRLLEDLEPFASGSLAWPDALRGIGSSLVRLTSGHPAAPFLLSRPYDTPRARAFGGSLVDILIQAGLTEADAIRLVQVSTGMLLGPSIHRATYAAAARRPSTTPAVDVDADGARNPAARDVEDRLSDWLSSEEADRLTVELWVAGVESLAERRRAARSR